MSSSQLCVIPRVSPCRRTSHHVRKENEAVTTCLNLLEKACSLSLSTQSAKRSDGPGDVVARAVLHNRLDGGYSCVCVSIVVLSLVGVANRRR